MFNPTRTALYLAIGAMALAADDANAGCKVISGTYVCASWIAGSEVCKVTIDGDDLQNPDVAPIVTCTVNSASYYEGDLLGCGDNLPPGTLECAYEGETEEGAGLGALAVKAGKKDKLRKSHEPGKHHCRHPDKDPGCSVGVPGVDGPDLIDGWDNPVSELSATTTADCDFADPGPTSCTATAEVTPEGLYCDGDTMSPAIDFTATQFVATVEVCGVDDSVEAPFDDGCVQLYQLCTLHGSQYSCVDLNDNPAYPYFDPYSCATGGGGYP
jgi:hypothetical protein